MLTVGGFIARVDDLVEIESSWRALKTDQFGIASDDELKFTFPEGHPTRATLDEAGYSHQYRVPWMLHTIGQMQLEMLANTQVDYRRNAAPRDSYLDSLKWCVRRFANHVPKGSGTHWVLVDMPSPPAAMEERELSDRLRDLHERLGTAPFDVYRRLYFEEENFGAGRQPGRPLRELGFALTVVAAHAKHSDILQIADAIAGCVREFCVFNLKNATAMGELPEPDYQEANLSRLAPKFRRDYLGRVLGIGFDIFPPRHPACAAIKQRFVDLKVTGQTNPEPWP